MPREEESEIFGMHSNADIAFQYSESEQLLKDVLSVQPRMSEKKEDSNWLEMVNQI